MSNELEIAAGASAGGFVRPLGDEHVAPPGTPCANCATPLMGPWCHACGQSGEDFHRSIVKLAAEVVEGLLHVDGRLWRTLPDLIIRPARLTRAYLEGHRAPQIPPLRLFLVVLLALFVVGGLTQPRRLAQLNHSNDMRLNGERVRVRTLDQLSPAERSSLLGEVGNVTVDLGPASDKHAFGAWLKDRFGRVLEDQERFKLILEQWAERFAFLMLPLAALMLSGLFVFQRRFYLFDHTIFSLHSLSAAILVFIAQMLLSVVERGLGGLLYLYLPVHLFMHMRGVYETGVVGTLFRMLLLFLGTLVCGIALTLGLVAVGLNGMTG